MCAVVSYSKYPNILKGLLSSDTLSYNINFNVYISMPASIKFTLTNSYLCKWVVKSVNFELDGKPYAVFQIRI